MPSRWVIIISSVLKMALMPSIGSSVPPVPAPASDANIHVAPADSGFAYILFAVMLELWRAYRFMSVSPFQWCCYSPAASVVADTIVTIFRRLNSCQTDLCRDVLPDLRRAVLYNLCRPPLFHLRRAVSSDLRCPHLSDIHCDVSSDLCCPPLSDLRRSVSSDLRHPPSPGLCRAVFSNISRPPSTNLCRVVSSDLSRSPLSNLCQDAPLPGGLINQSNPSSQDIREETFTVECNS